MNSKLKNALTDEQITRLNEVARKFAKYPLDKAEEFYWNLTYKSEFALQKMGLEGEEFLFHYKKVRNFILEESGQKESLYGGIEISEEEKGLFCCLQQDLVAFKRLKDVIDSILLDYSVESIKRIEFLLASGKEKNQFGALKSLKFNDDEAMFFLPAAEAISTYFTSNAEVILKNIAANEEKGGLSENESTEVSSSIAESIEEVKQETGENLIFEEDENSQKLEIIQALLKNKDCILRLFEYCKEVDSLWGSEDSPSKLAINYPFSFSTMLKTMEAMDKKFKQLEEEGINLNFLADNQEFIKILLTLNL